MDFVLVIAILHKIMYGMYEKRIRGKNRSIFFSLFLISCMCCVFPLLYLLSNTKKSLYQTSRDNHNNNNIILQGLHQCWNSPPPKKKKKQTNMKDCVASSHNTFDSFFVRIAWSSLSIIVVCRPGSCQNPHTSCMFTFSDIRTGTSVYTYIITITKLRKIYDFSKRRTRVPYIIFYFKKLL